MRRLISVLFLCQVGLLFPGAYSISFKSDKEIRKAIENDIPGEPLNPTDLQLARDLDDSKAGDPKTLVDDPSLSSGFYEGDIIVNDQQRDMILNDDGAAMFRNAVIDESLLWPNGIVPYLVSSQYDAEERRTIASGIQEFAKYTCIKFVPRTNQPHFIHIAKAGGCASHIGYSKMAQQPVSLGSGCVIKGIIIHELLHALGFWHEQSRPDRDNFVKIIKQNIKPGMEGNFVKASTSQVTDLGVAYDTGSVLHYGAFAFSVDRSKPTIVPNTQNSKMGQRVGFAKGDIEKVNKLYCQKKPVSPTPAPPTGCQDYSSQCSFWTQIGSCSSTSIRNNCPKSCNACERCEDDNKHCEYWANAGECTKNFSYMTKFCRKSCNLCQKGDTVPEGCNNGSQHCDYWASQGECQNNPAYMKKACKKACKQC